MTSLSDRIRDPPIVVDRRNTSPASSTSSPVVGDINRKVRRFQKLRASKSAWNNNHSESSNSENHYQVGKSPMQNLKKRLKHRRGNSEASPASAEPLKHRQIQGDMMSSPVITETDSSSHTEPRRLKRVTSKIKKTTSFRQKRNKGSHHNNSNSSNKESNKPRQTKVKMSSLVAKAMSTVRTRKEPSLVPDIDKIVPNTIASKISSSIQKRRTSTSSPSSVELRKKVADSPSPPANTTNKLTAADPFSSDAYRPGGKSKKKKKKKQKKPGQQQQQRGEQKLHHNGEEQELQHKGEVAQQQEQQRDQEETEFISTTETVEIPLAEKDKRRPPSVSRERRSTMSIADVGDDTAVTATDKPRSASRERMLRSSKASWKSDSDLNKKNEIKRKKAKKTVTTLEKFFQSDEEDDDIYDSEEITVASSEVPPPSPSQWKTTVSMRGFFKDSISDDSSSEEEDLMDSTELLKSSETRLPQPPQFSLSPKSPEQRGRSPITGERDRLDSSEMRFPQSPKREQQQIHEIELSDQVSPNKRRSSPPTPKQQMSGLELTPLSPHAVLRQSPKGRRVNSTDSMVSMTGDEDDPPPPEEDVTLRRSNSRDRLFNKKKKEPWEDVPILEEELPPVRKALKKKDFEAILKEKPNVAQQLMSPLLRKTLKTKDPKEESSRPGRPALIRRNSASSAQSRRNRSKSRDRSTVLESLENVEAMCPRDERIPHYATPVRGEPRKPVTALSSLENPHVLRRVASSSEVSRQHRSSSRTRTPRSSSQMDESPSSPMLEMQGSIEQLKKSVVPPFPKGKDTRNLAAAAALFSPIHPSDDDIDSDPEEGGLAMGTTGRRTNNKHRRAQSAQNLPIGRSSSSLSSSSSTFRNIQQESQQKHQRNLSGRENLMDVLSLAGGDGEMAGFLHSHH
ncbi:unnamed protein product [Cylindrotheca closterium]|uniref:Uncharacterized protein n=1 Tax=Cylindrotheca closterium TaxID=2856 RepID=A0AAD2FD17_9STRA|nr:unnamed protein product [Cylindrotheca closterium]